MPKYLIIIAGLALASCAAQKALPQLSEEQKRANERGIAYWQPEPTPADSTPLVHRPPVWTPDDSLRWALHKQAHQVDSSTASLSSLTSPVTKPRRRLLGLLPAKKVASSPQKVASDKLADGKLPRKCKGCTIVYGDNNTVADKKGQALGAGASNTQTGKKSGDIIKADSGAMVNKVAGPGNAQGTRGNNNTPMLTAPVQQPPDWRATLAKPAGYVVAAVGTVLIVGGCIFLIAAYKRRNLLNNNG